MFEAGRLRSYTRRAGEPNVSYVNTQYALYAQADIRIRRNLSVTPGVRVETQNHIKGVVAGPRVGATWAPFKNGKTTLRVSWGIFYDWLPTNAYGQTIRIDGFQQREINISDPTYPETPLDIAGVTPADRYLLDPALKHPKNSRVSWGVDHAFSPRFRLHATYRYVRGERLLGGLNLNAPVNGVRPSPQFGNVIKVVGDGAMRQHVWNFGGQTTRRRSRGGPRRAGIGAASTSSGTTRSRGARTTPTAPSACRPQAISTSSGATRCRTRSIGSRADFSHRRTGTLVSS